MIKANGGSNNIIKGLFCGSLAKFCSLVKVSYIVGSYAAFFSLSQCIVPLMGAYAGLSGSLLFCLLGMAARWVIAPIAVFKLFAFYVPGMIAGFTWIKEYRFVQVVVPVICMALFLIHPVGGAAWVYTLYWVLPVALYYSAINSVFAQSVASTFVAHAVGSTIWLYADPMSASVWIGLIPVVAYERLLLAVGMIIAYHAIAYVQYIIHAPASMRTHILGSK